MTKKELEVKYRQALYDLDYYKKFYDRHRAIIDCIDEMIIRRVDDMKLYGE